MSIYSQLVLPKGLGWGYRKTPKFSHIEQMPQSMRHPAVATLQMGVIYELELQFNYLKVNGVSGSNDVAYLQAFYEAQRGGYGWFSFDPSVYNLENMAVTQDYTQLRNGFFGIGDGVTTTFQLWRSTAALGGGVVTYAELIQNVTALTGVYVNGVVASPGTYSQANYPATVTFNTAPANGAILAWAGSYSYLCRFAEDQMDFEEFLFNIWRLRSLKLETINL